MADNAMDQVKHLVVVMMENRSFDNLLGFLYARENNTPPLRVLGRSVPGVPEFDGLSEGNPESEFWNPSNEDYFTGKDPLKVFAKKGTTGTQPFLAPNHDPHEEFDHITYQIMGPAGSTRPKIKGFLVDYITTDPGNPKNAEQLMESYAPEQLSVLSGLAKNYAVSDRWFCSTPNQTLPNRAFVHAGTSMGRVNNQPEPLYEAETIFEVLEDTGHSWRVYNDTFLMSLVRLQFPELWDPLLQRHFHAMGEFEEDAAAGTLPEYSFIEPSFQIQPNDAHPPHDVCLGEQFLLRIWNAVSKGKDWSNTLLVITFDEHGGCYDHVEPPPAEPPDEASNPGGENFRFDRFGVRIPTLLISPYIEPGTVFRSPTEVPYDHTTILATIRDWLRIPPEKMLDSRRIANAPTFANVLTRATPREDMPAIAAACVPKVAGVPLPIGLNDLQRVMVTAQRKRLVHGLLGNWPRLKAFGTPPSKTKEQ